MPTSKRKGGWSWMRAIGDRHDQPAGERGPGKSLPAHTTTRSQGRLGLARWMMSEHNISRTCASLVGDAGLAPARPLGTTLFESVLATRFQQPPVTSPPIRVAGSEAPRGTCRWGGTFVPVLSSPSNNWHTATECSCGLVVGVSALCEYRLTRLRVASVPAESCWGRIRTCDL